MSAMAVDDDGPQRQPRALGKRANTELTRAASPVALAEWMADILSEAELATVTLEDVSAAGVLGVASDEVRAPRFECAFEMLLRAPSRTPT